MTPDIRSSFEYNGKTIFVDWYTVTHKSNIPSLDWKQVYAIGNLDGNVPLVTSSTGMKQYNLPGGTIQPGESIEQALRRELIEECNMRVVDWEPLGYQICTNPDGTTVPQLRVYATLEKIGEFEKDPGGHVISHTLVPLDTVESMIQYGEIGDAMVALATPYFKGRNV